MKVQSMMVRDSLEAAVRVQGGPWLDGPVNSTSPRWPHDERVQVPVVDAGEGAAGRESPSPSSPLGAVVTVRAGAVGAAAAVTFGRRQGFSHGSRRA